MYRGTTPTFTFIAPDGLDMTEAQNVYVTFADSANNEYFTKSGDGLEIKTETVEGETVSSVGVYLSQEETLRFTSGYFYVQINWTYPEGGKTKRAASERISIKAKPNLLERVIE